MTRPATRPAPTAARPRSIGGVAGSPRRRGRARPRARSQGNAFPSLPPSRTRSATSKVGTATAQSYTYDAAGNRTAIKTGNTTNVAYTYNDDGRLATVAGVTLKYNAFGERQTSTVTGGGGIFIFGQDGLLLAEYTPAGVLVRNYLYLEGKPFALMDGAGTVSYVLTDQIDQPQKMLNSGGTVTWHRVAGVFGDTVSQPVGTTSTNPQRFPGQQQDPTSGLFYNYLRDYDPPTGRYIEPDPIGLAGGINLYPYVDGNPVGRADPTGEFLWAPIVTGAIIGGGFDLAAQLIENGGQLQCVDPVEVAAAALAGAALSSLGPTGALLGRGGARAVPYGYARTAGLLNHGATRVGWGVRGGTQDVLRVVVNGQKTDIPGTAIRSGARPLRDGVAAGLLGGGGAAANGSGDCGCQ